MTYMILIATIVALINSVVWFLYVSSDSGVSWLTLALVIQVLGIVMESQ